MPRKSVCDHQSGGDDASRSPISSEVDAQQSNTSDGASFHNVDLASTFPTTKVKAQILRDEGVGRISGKAIQLIGACSAIFVRELAEAAVSVAAAHENDDDEHEPSKDSPSLASNKVKAQGRKRKLSSSNSTKPKSEGDRPSPKLLTRDHIKDCIEQIEQDETKFDFLHGVISDNISAKEIPSYGAAYQKKVKREAAGSNRKGKSMTGAIKGKGAGGAGLENAASAAAIGASSVLIGSATGTAVAAASASSAGDEEALRKVIDASLQDGTGMVGLDDGIVEDDEEYD